MKLPSLPPPPNELEMIQSVSEDVVRPEEEPRRPHGALSARNADDVRHADPSDARLLETNKWERWADDVLCRNRKQYASLLWACDALRSYRDTPDFGRLGGPLTHALIRFGNTAGNVPTDPIERRQLVESWRAGARQ